MSGNDRRRGLTDKTRDAVGVSAEDAELFRRVLHDVVPMPGRRGRPEPAPSHNPGPATVNHAPAGHPAFKARPSAAPQHRAPTAKPQMPPLRTGVAIGLDHRSAERLRRGRMSVDARLDLHGHSQVEAHDAVIRFVADHAAVGHRCILIVTGKGARGGGVLRQRVPEWLAQPPCRGDIVATATARPNHGGDGALYVLLRRHRGSR